MRKIEALNYIRKHKGYVPYIGIFEIYNDNDEIPQGLIDLSIKESKTKENLIVCSEKTAKLIEDYQKNF